MRGSSLFEVTAVLVWPQLKQSDNAPDYAASIGFFIFKEGSGRDSVCVCVCCLIVLWLVLC